MSWHGRLIGEMGAPHLAKNTLQNMNVMVIGLRDLQLLKHNNCRSV